MLTPAAESAPGRAPAGPVPGPSTASGPVHRPRSAAWQDQASAPPPATADAHGGAAPRCPAPAGAPPPHRRHAITEQVIADLKNSAAINIATTRCLALGRRLAATAHRGHRTTSPSVNSPTAIRPTADISGNAGQTGSLTTPPTCNPTTKINLARSPDPAVHPGLAFRGACAEHRWTYPIAETDVPPRYRAWLFVGLPDCPSSTCRATRTAAGQRQTDQNLTGAYRPARRLLTAPVAASRGGQASGRTADP